MHGMHVRTRLTIVAIAAAIVASGLRMDAGGTGVTRVATPAPIG